MREKQTIYARALSLIRAALARDGFVIAAIDGGAASCKTTLAAQLSRALDAPVIAMDDFFLPPALRTRDRLAEIGGNIDYDRFDRSVAAFLRRREAFSYAVYDCHQDRMDGEKRVPRAPVILVEGVYSLHPRYRDAYTLRLLLRVPPAVQDQRLRARGGWLYQRFQAEWLPMEEKYFASENWDEICDAILDEEDTEKEDAT